MNHNKTTTFGIMLVMVLLLNACAAPKVDACSTTAPQSCPTTVAQSCPTAQACPIELVKVPITENVMTSQLTEQSDVTITFDPGNKCSLEGTDWIVPGLFQYDFVVNDTTYQTYYVAIVTLGEGKKLADLQALPDTYYAQPGFTDIVQMDFENPGSFSHHTIKIDKGPLYFACFVAGPNEPLRINEFGPLNVVNQ
jgi:hypothetical protein